MDRNVAEALFQFMHRVQLSGEEVPTFNTCMQALQQEMKEEPKKEAPPADKNKKGKGRKNSGKNNQGKK